MALDKLTHMTVREGFHVGHRLERMLKVAARYSEGGMQHGGMQHLADILYASAADKACQLAKLFRGCNPARELQYLKLGIEAAEKAGRDEVLKLMRRREAELEVKPAIQDPDPAADQP